MNDIESTAIHLKCTDNKKNRALINPKEPKKILGTLRNLTLNPLSP